MGGGDLNLKKSWHPVTMRNQERVWKEEQKAKEESRRVEQLRKELIAERAKMELTLLQEQAGLIKPSNRLEWMYSGTVASAAQLSTDRELYLLGSKTADEYLRKPASGSAAAAADAKVGVARYDIMGQEEGVVGGDSLLGRMTALGNANANTQRDLLAKVREDPLFDILKREQESIKQQQKPASLLGVQKQYKDDDVSEMIRKGQGPTVVPPGRRHQQVEENSLRSRRSMHSRNGRAATTRSRSPPRGRNNGTSSDDFRSRDRPQRRAHDAKSPYRGGADVLEAMVRNAQELDVHRRNRVSSQRQDGAPPDSSNNNGRPGIGLKSGMLLSGTISEAIGRRKHYLNPRDDRW